MPEAYKPLFNRHLLKSRMAGFELNLPEEQKRVVESWTRTVTTPSFLHEKEKPHQGEFLLQLFGSLLGYTPYIGSADDHNLKIETASKETKGGKTPDGCLGFFGDLRNVTRAVIELKAPAANLDLKQQGHGGLTPVEQGFGYAPKFDGCRWVIVSNFVTIRLYSTARGQACCHEWRVADLAKEETLREFVFLLHKDRLISQTDTPSFTAKLASETHTQEEKITKDFYAFYKGVRLRLFHQLVRDNPAPSGITEADHEVCLLEKAQKILDRVLFICFCEDTGLLPHGVIRKAIEAADGAGGFVQTTRWQQMVGLFHAIDKGSPPLGINGYNGGLFAEDTTLDSLTVADETLDDCLRLSEYDFETDLNVNILGHIFEQSISDLENLRAEIQGESIDRTKSKRKKEGVFYTPEYITRFIVENTIGSWLQERFAELEGRINPEAVRGKHKQREAYENLWTEYQDVLREIKVLDPACGSGAFLVAAFDYLHAEYRRVNDELAALRGGQASLFDLDKQILQENLFGVDINHESVEITKLSLWLKSANREKPLNNLDGNIKCGNSLIDSDTGEDNPELALAYGNLPDEIKRRAFEWRKEFPKVFEKGGFDCVIGNPPYIRSEWLKEYKSYLEAEYNSFNSGADIYIYFFERGLRLARDRGKLGFITSGSFARTAFAKEFRKWLPTIASFQKLINFGENQPFEDAEMIYPTISIIRKDKLEAEFETLFLSSKIPSSIEADSKENCVLCDHAILYRAEWVFIDSNIISLSNRILSAGTNLGSLFPCYYGIKTGFNDAFVIDRKKRNKILTLSPNAEDIIRPMLGGEDFRPWYHVNNERWLVVLPSGWTRQFSGSSNEATSWRWLSSSYSSIADHLSEFEEQCRKRTDQGEFWWELRSCDYYDAFKQNKIFWPDIAKQPRFSIERRENYISNTASFLNFESEWIISILQSKVIWFLISQIATPLRLRAGLWQFRCIKQFIERLPIPNIPTLLKPVLSALAIQSTDIANKRYKLHEDVRSRILTDLGGGVERLNQKLTAWYDLPIKSFRAEIKKTFKQDIPLKERTEWEQALAEWQDEHQKLTSKLIDVETEINDRVYKLYGLSDADVQLLEDHMKKNMIFYPLGSV